MTHFPHATAQRRATRIHFGNSVPALLHLQDGQRAKAKLRTVSVTGGLLRLAQAMEAGDFVEVAFQSEIGPVRGMAELLSPVTSRDGALQPFRFIALADEDHRALRNMVDLALDRNSVHLHSLDSKNI